jgi:hypothetical protein
MMECREEPWSSRRNIELEITDMIDCVSKIGFASSEGKVREHGPRSRRVFLMRSVEDLDLNPAFRHSKRVERI